MLDANERYRLPYYANNDPRVAKERALVELALARRDPAFSAELHARTLERLRTALREFRGGDQADVITPVLTRTFAIDKERVALIVLAIVALTLAIASVIPGEKQVSNRS
jgi:hypothetical protein